MDRFSTSSEIVFHGLPSKNKRPSIRKQIVTVNSIVFTKQASAERYLANIFCQYFCEILENFAANHKNVSKTIRKFSKVLESSWQHKLSVYVFIGLHCLLPEAAIRVEVFCTKRCS